MNASDYHDIGRYLKDSRESLRLSVTDVAHAMHMRVHYVDAIESGNLDILPGKAYVRGYIKNYALFLGIDPTETLAAYDALSGSVKRELYIPEPTVKENLPSRALMIIALSAAIIMGGYYMLVLKDSHVHVAGVEEVPSSLLLAAAGTQSTHNAQWMECLNGEVNGCFNMKISDEVLDAADAEYRTALKFLCAL
jgi:cytoskeletal protein RodZ